MSAGRGSGLAEPYISRSSQLLIAWFDPNVAVCKSGKVENLWHPGDWKMTHMLMSPLNNASFISFISPAGAGFGIWCWNLTSIRCIWRLTVPLSLSFLITTACLLETSQTPSLGGKIAAFVFSVTFMQDMEKSFNYPDHPPFIGSTSWFLRLTVFSGISCFRSITTTRSLSLSLSKQSPGESVL